MKVRYTDDARLHIAEVGSYISRRDTFVAQQVAARIRAKAELLGEFPHIGRAGIVSGTYETTVKGLPYIIVYEIRATIDVVVVLAVFHGAQDRG
jgi:toxin ParE1/3/4